MTTCDSLVPLLLTLFLTVQCTPISQPAYDNTQYNVQTQSFPVVQYKPQQLHFKPGAAPRPVYEQQQSEGLQYYSSQPKSVQSIQTPAIKPVQQSFLPTSQGYKQLDSSIYDQVLKSQQNYQRKPVPQPVYQPQPVKYAQPTQQTQFSAKYQQVRVQPQQAAVPEGEDKEDEGDFDPNPSYQFGFDVKDDQYTNYQTRKEERDGKKITGSYSVVDADGYIRTVKYTADPKEGFKAEVSREPTNIVIKTPKPEPQYQALPNEQPQQQQQYQTQQQYRPAQPQQQYQAQQTYQPQQPAHRQPQLIKIAPARPQQHTSSNAAYSYQ